MKRRKQKILALLLAVSLLCLSAASCGKQPADSGQDSSSNDMTSESSSSAGTSTPDTSSPPESSGGEVGGQTEAIGLLTKKGVCTSLYSTQPAKLKELNISWYYDWGVSTPPSGVGMEYVPMIWGAGSVNGSNPRKIKDGFEKGIYKNLLTFNEPDLPEQSNMTVEQAIALWPKLEEIGIRLGSPCPAASENYCGGWLADFMAQCQEKGYRVDFIAVHCYQDVCNSESVASLKTLLTQIYEKYGLPIWLTEFGAIDTGSWFGNPNPNYSEEAAVRYIQECTAMLESLGFVERYSWFVEDYGGGANPTEGRYSRLFRNGELAATGKAYRDVESQKPLLLQTDELPAGTVGKAYQATVKVAGGTAPYTFIAEGLPKGLSIDGTGNISGTASDNGSYKIKITVKDAKGQQVTKSYSIFDESQFPLTVLNKSGWTANYSEFLGKDPWFTATDAKEIIDGRADTKFTIPRKQTTNDVFQILFNQELEVCKLIFTSGSPGEYPKDFKVQICLDGQWVDCALKTKSTGDKTEVAFEDTVRTTGIILQLQADAAKSWSIAEFDAYGY